MNGFDSLLSLIIVVFVIGIGITAVKKAIGCVVMLAVLFIFMALAFSCSGSGAL